MRSLERTSQKKLLRKIWFKFFPRERNTLVASCGFKHVFMKEIIKNGYISGLHNWIYFYDQERDGQNDLDYKGYMKSVPLGNVSLIS